MPYIIKVTPGQRSHPGARRRASEADLRDLDRYLAQNPRILVPVARKNLGMAPDIQEGSDVLVWRNDMTNENSGGLIGVGQTSSPPQRAEHDILSDGIRVIAEANDWYVEINVSERFESPPVRIEDINREFSGTEFLEYFRRHRANVNYPIDADLFQRIRQMAMPTTGDEFHARTWSLRRSTEAERLAIQRVGQDLFRRDLLDYWQRRCAISGLGVPELLRASHARPWARCETDDDRVNCFNGLLLAAHLDAAFERGLIGVEEDGTVVVSRCLSSEARGILGLDVPRRIEGLRAEHRPWLFWHRMNKFERSS
jgi:hypothetical protein